MGTPELQHLRVDDPLERFEAALETDGALVVDDFIPPSLCDQLMADFLPHIETAEWCNTDPGDPINEFFGLKTKRFHGLAGLSLHSDAIICHSLLLRLAYHLLGAGKACRDVRVSTAELMVLGHGEVKQAFHRDFDSWPYVARKEGQHGLVSANVALCDFTERNGATVVVPGSHKWPHDRQPQKGEACQAVMRKGSALIYSGDVVHSGGSNHEEQIRTGFYIGFIPSWLSALENHATTNPPEALSALSDKARTLLGIVPGGYTVIP